MVSIVYHGINIAIDRKAFQILLRKDLGYRRFEFLARVGIIVIQIQKLSVLHKG